MRSPFVHRLKPAILAFALASAVSAQAQDLPDLARREIGALLAEKASRNPAQAKMDSHLVHAAEILRGQPVSPGSPNPPGELESVHRDVNDFVEVDIRADVTAGLLALIRSLGGSVVNSFPEYQSVRARLPLLSVERVAGRAEVRQIRLAEQAFVNGATEGPDSYGDAAHQGGIARSAFNLDGTGVKIGVLSDGVNSLTAEESAGRLPAVNVIAGQAGSGDEGTAMLEIVYTLAPGATLYYATGDGSEAQMATNIQALANAGCNIIVDDVGYFSEGVYQDDTVAKEVDAVTAAGVLYFSAAGNSGSLEKNTSGTWQGNFKDSGTTLSDNSATVAVHSFGSANYDTLTVPSSVIITSGGIGVYELMWSDPLGASNNDYDLFITSASGSVLASSTNIQDGAQNPEEDITGSTAVSSACGAGTCRIVIVKHASAAPRALFLSTERGELSIATDGATYGHAAAASAVGTAATDARYAIPQNYPSCSGFSAACNHGVETYSSDGPRQMFYNADGSAITPGSVMIGPGSGAVLNKPDLTAADNVNTGVAGFTTFSGTSAAAPHAAAIAALLLEAVPTLTATAIRAALTAGAIDIEGPAPNVNAGAGIVMATAAVEAACAYSAGSLSSVAVSGASASLAVQAGQNCPWTLGGLPSWISGATSGMGAASVPLTIAANAGAARSATVTLTAGTLTLASGTITQASSQGASQTISFGSLSNVTFGASPFTISATATSGLTVTFASTTVPVCTVSGSTVTAAAGGVCSIMASQLGNATYASATPVTRSFTINPGTQTISFGALANVTFGVAPFTIGATASSGLAVSFASTTASVCAVSGDTVTILAGGSCSIAANQAGNLTYAAATAVTQSFTVNPGPQTITFGALGSMTFGASPFNVSATASSGLTVSFASSTASVCTVSGNTVTMVAGGTCSVVASQPGNATYAAATPVTQSFSVNPASQSIAFGTLGTVPFGSSPFTVSATASSGLTVSFASTTTSVCTVSGATVSVLTTGTCSIVASQLGNASYRAATPVTESFTVSPASQTITFAALSNAAFSAASITLSATSTSGLTVTFTSGTTSVCTVSGSTVTLVALGSCSITAHQAGGSGYLAAVGVTRSFTVTQGSQTITFGALSDVAFGVAPFGVSATASSSLAVSFASSTAAVCTVSSGTVTIVAPGTCSIVASQAGNADYSAAASVTKSFKVNAGSQTVAFGALSNVVFGVAPFTVGATASSGLTVGFASTTASVCTVSGNTVTIIAGGLCSIDASQAGNADYAAATAVTQSFTVIPASQTIAFGALSNAAFGAAPFTVSATASSGLTVSFASTTASVCTVSGNTVTIVAGGQCSVAASQAGDADFAAAAAVTQSFTVSAISYLVGDVAPYTSDTAPNFGDGALNILDLIQELFAVNNVPGYRPAACSDRFDAMDTYPADTATTRGGDGLLDIRDLIEQLFRVNNLDPSRPVRTSPGGVCVGGSSTTSSIAAPTQGALALGRPEPYGAAQERMPVYLEATQDLVNVAVTLALGDGQTALRFLPAAQTQPSFVHDGQPGVVAAAWLNGVSVPSGQRLLLGYVTGAAGSLSKLKLYGASASGLDGKREVRLGL